MKFPRSTRPGYIFPGSFVSSDSFPKVLVSPKSELVMLGFRAGSEDHGTVVVSFVAHPIQSGSVANGQDTRPHTVRLRTRYA